MTDNVCMFSLEYSFVIDPKLIGIDSYFATNGKLWNQFIDNDEVYQMVDNLVVIQQLVEKINLENDRTSGNHITLVKPQINNRLITITIYGSSDFINESKLQILKVYNQIDSKSVQLNQGQYYLSNLIPYIYDIAQKYLVEIIINNCKSMGDCNVSDDFYIHIIGNIDNITLGETAVRVLIDCIVNKFFVDSIEIDLSLIPIIGGPDLFNFNQISKQTNSNIYVPDLLPNLHLNQTIFITGKNLSEIYLTRSIIENLIKQNGKFYIKSIDIMQNKLTSLLLYNQSQILNIMFNFGVFIKLPCLGDSNQTIIIQGSCENSVDDAMNELNLIFTDYYTINIHKKYQDKDKDNKLKESKLKDGKSKNIHKSTLESKFLQSSSTLYQLLIGKACNISNNKYGIEINANSQEIKQIIPYLSCLNIPYVSINLRLELSNSQLDFISGKKNGKLTKILNQLNHLPTIKFKNYHDYNFFIDFTIGEKIDISYLIKGLELIEMELPSELHFNVPEVFHKSIIGNGGSIIQLIMKKYNVFIKFSSFDQIKSIKPSYSFTRSNNVLIKCPRKNSTNIQLVKYEIDQLVQQCCQLTTSPNYSTRYFKLMKSDYLLLINNNQIQLISNLEIEFNCFINFPTCLEDFKGKNQISISIKGNESKISPCINKLNEIILKKYEFKIAFNLNKFKQYLIHNQEFIDRIIIPFKITLGIELSILKNEEFHSIIINYHQLENLSIAIKNLTTYLREKDFLIVDKKPFTLESSDIKLPLNSITNRVHNFKNQKLNNQQDLVPLSLIPKGIW